VTTLKAIALVTILPLVIVIRGIVHTIKRLA
jgi:hypothetical protein